MRSLLFIIIVFAAPAHGNDPLLGQVGPYLHKVRTSQSAEFKAQVDSLSKGVRILGLGEVSHFTRESYELKAAIIQRVMRSGFDGLILEVDFGQAQIWDQYVTKGVGDLDSIIARSGWFTYRTEEFKSLLAAIRTHNVKARKPFRIFGMEMTAINHNLRWLSRYLDPVLAADDPLRTALDEERKIVAFQPHELDEVEAIWALYIGVRSALASHQASLLKDSADDWQTAQRITEILRQFATYVSQDQFHLQTTMRDLFSTDNVRWVMNHLGESSRVVVWAHNGHVSKRSVLFNYDVLGHHLSRQFGEQYMAVGFTFNQGEFGAFSDNGFKRWRMEEVTEPSLTKSFSQLESPLVMLNVREHLAADINHQSPLRKFQSIRTDISENRSENAPDMMQIDLSRSYDWLIYFEQSSYPTPIDWIREPEQ